MKADRIHQFWRPHVGGASVRRPRRGRPQIACPPHGPPASGAAVRALAIALLGLAAFALSDPAVAQSPSPASPAGLSQEQIRERIGGAVLWTDKPVRVDPDRFQLRRAPARLAHAAYPDRIYVPRFVRVSDSTSFEIDGRAYRLFNVAPVSTRMICRDVEGRRFACGHRARMTLRGLITGKMLACRAIGGPPSPDRLVACELNNRSLAEQLVRAGAAQAMAPIPPFLRDAHRFALDLRVGLWSDVATALAARADGTN